jgi:predicted TIM-barrel fold metal-dependent hydrolase
MLSLLLWTQILISTASAFSMKVIDSHLHVWANENESSLFPYADEKRPPENLINISSTDDLLHNMQDAGVDGALIVQPINYLYNHEYVSNAIKMYPDKFKGMMLFDPSLKPEDAVNRLEELVLKGFVGVRFNPYLFDGEMSANGSAIAVMKRCGELQIPVGIMCFKGIELHHSDIVKLCSSSPETVVILDHFGFAKVGRDDQFHLLLDLERYNTVVKISALFRVKGEDEAFPYEAVRKQRFEKLLQSYGAGRLLMGTDFPYVQLECGYRSTIETIKSWVSGEDDLKLIMSGTAERLFGVWGNDK